MSQEYSLAAAAAKTERNAMAESFMVDSFGKSVANRWERLLSLFKLKIVRTRNGQRNGKLLGRGNILDRWESISEGSYLQWESLGLGL